MSVPEGEPAAPDADRRSGGRARVPKAVGLLAVLALVVTGALVGRRRALAVPDLSAVDADIRAAAREFDLDPDLLRGLVAAESGGDPKAVSGAGAVGLLQLMPGTAAEQARRLGVRDYARDRLTEPALNLRLGASYLARLLRRFDGEPAFAIAAYNAGPRPVLRWRERAPDASAAQVIEREGYEETRRHVRKVLRFKRAYARRAAPG
jgi:soluble lytic murein transglycosylase